MKWNKIIGFYKISLHRFSIIIRELDTRESRILSVPSKVPTIVQSMRVSGWYQFSGYLRSSIKIPVTYIYIHTHTTSRMKIVKISLGFTPAFLDPRILKVYIKFCVCDLDLGIPWSLHLAFNIREMHFDPTSTLQTIRLTYLIYE